MNRHRLRDCRAKGGSWKNVREHIKEGERCSKTTRKNELKFTLQKQGNEQSEALV